MRVASTDTATTSTPSVIVEVGANSKLQANDIDIDGNVIGNAAASTANSGGGLVSVGAANSKLTLDSTSEITIGTNAELRAENNIDILSITDQKAQVLAQSDGGGLVDIADADASADLDYASTIDIDSGAYLFAEERLSVRRKAIWRPTLMRIRTLRDWVPAPTPSPRWTSAARRQRANDRYHRRSPRGNTVDVTAIVSSLDAHTNAVGEANALGANTDAQARLRFFDNTAVDLNSGGDVIGGQVTIKARHENIDVTSYGFADCDCGGGAADSVGEVDYESQNRIVTSSGSKVSASSLLVQAEQAIDRYDRIAEADVAFIGREVGEELGDSPQNRKRF